MMKGVILATHGVAGVVAGLSVGRIHTPGPLPNVYGTLAWNPSWARACCTSVAACSPSATPRVLAGPSLMFASEVA